MPITFIPPLVHLASVKVGYGLFINSAHRLELEFIRQHQFNPESWEDCWERTTEDAVRNLIIPPSLKENLKKIIRPMGEEILDWKAEMLCIHREGINVMKTNTCNCVNPEISNFLDFYKCPQMTSIGSIDEKKSAQTLIENPMLDTPFRFLLACVYCFESKVINLWQQLFLRQKRLFSKSKDDILIPMIVYWIEILEEAEITFLTILPPFQPPHIDEYHHNPSVMHYILGKLPVAQRRKYLRSTAKRSLTDPKLLRACLLQMDSDQLMLFLTHKPERVLHCFLKWPWQFVFLKFLENIWSLLKEDHLFNIMQFILQSKVNHNVDDYDYVSLIREIWNKAPRHFQEYVQYFVQHDAAWKGIIA